MAMLLPLLTELDPRVSTEGSIDPLGTYAVADALAVRMIPGVRERQRHPRFLTAIAVSHVLCDDHDADVVARDGISEPWQVFEWYMVEGLVRTESEKSQLRGLPGHDKASSALKDNEPLSATRYLKTPTVFGFHGIYRALARDVELERAGRLSETGYKLATTWEAEQGLTGFLGSSTGNGSDLKRSLKEAIQEGIKRGATARSATWQGWAFFRNHLGIYSVGRGEATILCEALLNPSSGHRGELLSFLVSPPGNSLWSELSKDGAGSERAFHAALHERATQPLQELLEAIRSYERFSRLLEDAFNECLSEMSRPQRRVRLSELAGLSRVKHAAEVLSELYPEVRDRLLPFGQAIRFMQGFGDLAEQLSPDDWVERLLGHHSKIQLAKPPAGKAPWIDRFDDGSFMIRSGYVREAFGGRSEEYVHSYRTASLWSFARDLRLVN
jgi:hypothetical protein